MANREVALMFQRCVWKSAWIGWVYKISALFDPLLMSGRLKAASSGVWFQAGCKVKVWYWFTRSKKWWMERKRVNRCFSFVVERWCGVWKQKSWPAVQICMDKNQRTTQWGLTPTTRLHVLPDCALVLFRFTGLPPTVQNLLLQILCSNEKHVLLWICLMDSGHFK